MRAKLTVMTSFISLINVPRHSFFPEALGFDISSFYPNVFVSVGNPIHVYKIKRPCIFRESVYIYLPSILRENVYIYLLRIFRENCMYIYPAYCLEKTCMYIYPAFLEKTVCIFTQHI